jgi:hypothetical protein
MPKIPGEEKSNMIVAKASKCFALILSMMRDLARANSQKLLKKQQSLWNGAWNSSLI